jgi:exopolyphosphatase / guanosine-5'-triphosphate,3'-diphosphate pyrophosphatase
VSVTVDANILVYASNEAEPVHPQARRLVESLAAGPEILGYQRIVTHPSVLPHHLHPRSRFQALRRDCGCGPLRLAARGFVLRGLESGLVGKMPSMLCAAIDIGSNTTRVLVAEPVDGQLKKVMEQRAYTRINKALGDDGVIPPAKTAEVAEVVSTQVRLANELGAEAIRIVATAAIREAANGDDVAGTIGEQAGAEVEILSEEEEGRLSFIGATKGLGHPVEGKIGVVDVGGGSTELILGTVAGGGEDVRSWPVGSGALADELIDSDPPSPAAIRRIRDRIDDIFEGVEVERPEQAVAVGGSATSLRRLVGSVLEYETLERGVRVLTSDPAVEVAKRFELDPVRVRILPTGVLLLEKLSDLLGQPLQIGKGGLREGVILDLLNGNAGGSSRAELAA